MFRGVVDALRGIPEVAAVGLEDIFHIFLRIQVDIREIGALYLYLNFMPLLKSMGDILQRQVHTGDFTRLKSFPAFRSSCGSAP